MESDMNSRRVIAGRQMTGDSGILSEVLIRVVYHCTFFIATLSGNRATFGTQRNILSYIMLHYYTHR